MLEAVPESSHLLVLHAPNSLSSLSELQSPSNSWVDTVDQSVCHIKSAWLLVTLQLYPGQAQPINKILKTLHHIIVLSTLSPCHNSENDTRLESVATIIEIFLLGSPRMSVANA